jgi:hypothetical protein
MYKYIYVRIFIYVYKYIYVHPSSFIYVNININVYVYIYIYIYVHIYIYIDGPMQIDFLAWILELAIREMPPDCDKYLIFVHLENFSLMNNPSMTTVREVQK